MPLDEIRKGGRCTRQKLAKTPGLNQDRVSKIEQGTDTYISSLAGYLEALAN